MSSWTSFKLEKIKDKKLNYNRRGALAVRVGRTALPLLKKYALPLVKKIGRNLVQAPIRELRDAITGRKN